MQTVDTLRSYQNRNFTLMNRIEPLTLDDLSSQMRKDLSYAEELMGFTPNDVLTMARWPAFLNAVRSVVEVVYAPGELNADLKRMIATIVNGAAGCRYCQAHTAHGAVKMAGTAAKKIINVWEFETSELFDDAERAALSLALSAGMQPNSATSKQFRELEQHFSSQQIMEIMGVISLFGLLNRWNDTLATPLEDAPPSFARSNLRQENWVPGHHVKR